MKTTNEIGSEQLGPYSVIASRGAGDLRVMAVRLADGRYAVIRASGATVHPRLNETMQAYIKP